MRPPHLLTPRLHLHWGWPHCDHPCAGNRAVEHAQRRIAERAIRGGLDGRSLRPQRERATGSGAGGASPVPVAGFGRALGMAEGRMARSTRSSPSPSNYS